MTTTDHLLDQHEVSDGRLRPKPGSRPRLAWLRHCRFCGLTRQEHGVHLIHRFAGPDPFAGGDGVDRHDGVGPSAVRGSVEACARAA